MEQERKQGDGYINIAPSPDVLIVATLRELDAVLEGRPQLAKGVRERLERARRMLQDYADCLERLWAMGREIPWKDPRPGEKKAAGE